MNAQCLLDSRPGDQCLAYSIIGNGLIIIPLQVMGDTGTCEPLVYYNKSNMFRNLAEGSHYVLV